MARTKPGQASWAGDGSKKCGGCMFFEGKLSPHGATKGRCRKYAALQKLKLSQVPYITSTTPACDFHEQ